MRFFNKGGKDRPITPKTIRDISDDEIEANLTIADEDDLEEFAKEKSELYNAIAIGEKELVGFEDDGKPIYADITEPDEFNKFNNTSLENLTLDQRDRSRDLGWYDNKKEKWNKEKQRYEPTGFFQGKNNK